MDARPSGPATSPLPAQPLTVSSPPPPTTTRRRRWRRLATVAVGLIGVGIAAYVLYNNSDELLAAADNLGDIRPGWVLLAVVAEAACYLARGSAQRLVLRSGASPSDAGSSPAGGEREVSPLVMGATIMAGDAAAYCLPLGFAVGGAVMIGQLRRRRVNEVLAAWTFSVSTLLYVAVLAVLGIVAVQLAGQSGDTDPVPGLQTASSILLAALLLAGGVAVVVRRARPGGTVARLIGPLRRRAARRLASRAADGRDTAAPGSGAGRLRGLTAATATRLRGWWAQLRSLRLSPAVLAMTAAGMLISWLCDISVLALAFVALGIPPPWLGLLLAYCAGQIASSVPVTPGGLGVVEGSLTLALVAFGGSTTATLSAVLLYRLIAYWSIIPCGTIAWLALRATSRPAGATP